MYEASGAKIFGDLCNSASKEAASGVYLIIAEVNGNKGTYVYLAKVGVRK